MSTRDETLQIFSCYVLLCVMSKNVPSVMFCYVEIEHFSCFVMSTLFHKVCSYTECHTVC